MHESSPQSESRIAIDVPTTTGIAAWRADGTPADLPRWTTRFMTGECSVNGRTSRHIDLLERSQGSVRHRTAIVRNATVMNEATFTEQACTAYTQLLNRVDSGRIFRIWNFIPRIEQRDSSGLDRYMRFNTARFQAFAQHSQAEPGYPPASGVGHEGNDLVLHLLEGEVSIRSLDNPRQIPPERYSRTWGPLPPVFVRGAIVDGLQDQRLVIVSGTASVRGEDTVFKDDLDRQLDETIENLGSLLSVACGTSPSASPPRLDSMLVYVSQREHLETVKARVDVELATPDTDVEFRLGRLCRENLLVEIEGVHALGASDAQS